LRPHGMVAMRPIFWHHPQVVKTLALEDIYADPHKLDSYLDSGEPVAVMRGGRVVAEFVPHKDALKTGETPKRPFVDFHARFLEMWGPDAFDSTVSVAEQFEELRGIARGERAIQESRVLTHAEARKRMARWLT